MKKLLVALIMFLNFTAHSQNPTFPKFQSIVQSQKVAMRYQEPVQEPNSGSTYLAQLYEDGINAGKNLSPLAKADYLFSPEQLIPFYSFGGLPSGLDPLNWPNYLVFIYDQGGEQNLPKSSPLMAWKAMSLQCNESLLGSLPELFLSTSYKQDINFQGSQYGIYQMDFRCNQNCSNLKAWMLYHQKRIAMYNELYNKGILIFGITLFDEVLAKNDLDYLTWLTKFRNSNDSILLSPDPSNPLGGLRNRILDSIDYYQEKYDALPAWHIFNNKREHYQDKIDTLNLMLAQYDFLFLGDMQKLIQARSAASDLEKLKKAYSLQCQYESKQRHTDTINP
ncbi:MAG: hypothetical protein QE271_09855 [Bacteriovoracaceae bacterium]|nr:hypothetical protein [Bacteriovoracaceae bacterium]